jgi:hypothetical protein
VHQQQIEEAIARRIAESIEGWPIEVVAAVAIVDVDVVIVDLPAFADRELAQSRELTVDRVSLSLQVSTHSCIECDSHDTTSIARDLPEDR